MTYSETIRAAISDAYYDARNAGRTMEQAADDAVSAVMAVPDVRAALALLTWYQTTHGNTIGEHDHHCRGSRWEERPHRSGLLIQAGPHAGTPLTEHVEVETDEPCTCGWRAAREALEAVP